MATILTLTSSIILITTKISQPKMLKFSFEEIFLNIIFQRSWTAVPVSTWKTNDPSVKFFSNPICDGSCDKKKYFVNICDCLNISFIFGKNKLRLSSRWTWDDIVKKYLVSEPIEMGLCFDYLEKCVVSELIEMT